MTSTFIVCHEINTVSMKARVLGALIDIVGTCGSRISASADAPEADRKILTEAAMETWL
jgi:hypothetical protein